MNQEQKINPEYIRIAGEKIKNIVSYIFIQIAISIVFFSLFSTVENSEGYIFLGGIWSILNIILGFLSLKNLYDSGDNLIKSTILVERDRKVPTKKKDDINESGDYIILKKYYENGNLKVIESYNKENIKDGIWEYYKENGDLDLKVLYNNGMMINQGFD
ncbi:MAG: hypothetical protein HWE07_02585 [Cytophagia bacterium]|nr:hypothetical protein [Cytophagia bacterium]